MSCEESGINHGNSYALACRRLPDVLGAEFLKRPLSGSNLISGSHATRAKENRTCQQPATDRPQRPCEAHLYVLSFTPCGGAAGWLHPHTLLHPAVHQAATR